MGPDRLPQNVSNYQSTPSNSPEEPRSNFYQGVNTNHAYQIILSLRGMNKDIRKKWQKYFIIIIIIIIFIFNCKWVDTRWQQYGYINTQTVHRIQKKRNIHNNHKTYIVITKQEQFAQHTRTKNTITCK